MGVRRFSVLIFGGAVFMAGGFLGAQLTSESASQPATTLRVQILPPSTRKSVVVKSMPFLATAPIEVVIKLLDPDHGFKPKSYDGEGGSCETKYHSDFNFDSELPKVRNTGKDFTATMKCQEPWARITVAFDLWLPAHSPEWLTDHEETHRAISERIYAEAAPQLSAMLKAMNGKVYEGHGVTDAAARRAAHEGPLNEFNEAYMRLVPLREDRLNREFDRITQHGVEQPKSNREIMEDIFAADGKRVDTAPATKP